MREHASAQALARGSTALVTGASAGIGEGFARALAARGINLILVARREERLRALASTLAAAHGITAETVGADLAAPDDLVRAARIASERQVDLLINNAGFGTYGEFATIDAGSEAREIALNAGAVVEMAHAVVPGMIARKRGGMINVTSTAAYQGLPYMAVYGATKAFVLSFSNALTIELAPHGIHVLALAPGFTVSEFAEISGEAQSGRRRYQRSVADVVATALRAFERRKMNAIDGRFNALFAEGARLAPRSLSARIAARIMRPAT